MVSDVVDGELADDSDRASDMKETGQEILDRAKKKAVHVPMTSHRVYQTAPSFPAVPSPILCECVP